MDKTMDKTKTSLQELIEKNVTNGLGYCDLARHAHDVGENSALELEFNFAILDARARRISYFATHSELSHRYRRMILDEHVQEIREGLQKVEKVLAEDYMRDHYTLTDALKKPFKSAAIELFADFQPPTPFSGGKWKKRCKHIGTILGSFGFTAVPHELIHAGVNAATGGVNKEIVINTLYGGPFWEQLIPGIESKVLIPIIGGYVDPEPASRLAEFAMTVAPYSLTPLGLYLVMKSREKKSFPLWAGGIGALAAHEGGIIGDWWHAGRIIATECLKPAYDVIGIEEAPSDESFPVLLGGFYIGAKLLSFTYRTMKGAINSLRSYFSKPQQAVIADKSSSSA